MTENFVRTKDGVEIFYKDWGPKDAQPIVFHHGWPLSGRRLGQRRCCTFSARAIASSPTTGAAMAARPRSSDGHDMDHYAADAGGVTDASRPEQRGPYRPLHRRRRSRATMSARHGSRPRRQGRCSSARCRRSWSRPTANPGGLPIEVFDGFRGGARRQPRAVLPRRCRPARSTASTARARRSRRASIRQLVAAGHDGQRQGALRRHQGLLGDRLHRRPEDDRRADAGACTATTTRSCPIADAAPLSAKLLKNGTLKVYEGYPHGMLTTHADVVNPDLLAFIKA